MRVKYNNEQMLDIALHILQSELFMQGFTIQDLEIRSDEDYHSLNTTIDIFPETKQGFHLRRWVGPVSGSG